MSILHYVANFTFAVFRHQSEKKTSHFIENLLLNFRTRPNHQNMIRANFLLRILLYSTAHNYSETSRDKCTISIDPHVLSLVLVSID